LPIQEEKAQKKFFNLTPPNSSSYTPYNIKDNLPPKKQKTKQNRSTDLFRPNQPYITTKKKLLNIFFFKFNKKKFLLVAKGSFENFRSRHTVLYTFDSTQVNSIHQTASSFCFTHPQSFKKDLKKNKQKELESNNSNMRRMKTIST
jgi:hypothetical protein